jgi:serine/threonine protein kinase
MQLAETGLSHLLRPGFKLLNGAYAIGKTLGQGGFGITYMGSETRLRRPVAIKEFLPNGCMRQNGGTVTLGRWEAAEFAEAKRRFLEEAEILSQFGHRSIVRVYHAFEENNTAYMVMELLKGRTLKRRLEESGAPPEEEAIRIVLEAGEALEEIHRANLLHRDVKPDNIMQTDDGRTALIDFGAAKEYIAGATQSHSLTLTPGYAPLEQYARRAHRGPYTDVYALAATLYHLLTGEEPPAATDRAAGVDLVPPHRLNRSVSPPVSHATLWGMEMRVENRPQTLQEFLAALRGEIAPPGLSVPSASAAPAVPAPAPPHAPSPSAPPAVPEDVVQNWGCEFLLGGCLLMIAVFFILITLLFVH